MGKRRVLACDLVVVGGGPAGSTLAGLFKKHNPGRRVVLLERADFPRHHIGESLLPGVIPILKELGAFEKIEKGGFVRKIGATYVWGKSRKPMNVSLAYDGKGGDSERPGYAWQVHRARYDQILLDHARELGVEVLQPCSAVSVLRKGKRVTGLLAHDASGPLRIEAGHLADCTGQGALLDRSEGIRRAHPGLRNIAVYAYYRGDPFRCRHSGSPEASRIFISQAAGGWFWYIPISAEVVSVGFVAKQSRLKDLAKDGLERLYAERLKLSPEIAPLLRGLERVENMDGSGKSLFAIQDYSYESKRACGEGWIAAGDAAYFVDPILSTGVLLAHLSGMRAAYGLTTKLRLGEKDPFAKTAWEDYNVFVRQMSSAFFEMALYWYEQNSSLKGWCRLSRRLAAGGRRFSPRDLDAFIHLSSGVRAFESATIGEDLLADEGELTASLTRRGSGGAARPVAPAGRRWKPRLTVRCEFFDSALMTPGTGLLRPARKARFILREPPFPAGANPTMTVTPGLEAAIRNLDGRSPVEKLQELARGRERRQGSQIDGALRHLREAGVLR